MFSEHRFLNQLGKGDRDYIPMTIQLASAEKESAPIIIENEHVGEWVRMLERIKTQRTGTATGFLSCPYLVLSFQVFVECTFLKKSASLLSLETYRSLDYKDPEGRFECIAVHSVLSVRVCVDTWVEARLAALRVSRLEAIFDRRSGDHDLREGKHRPASSRRGAYAIERAAEDPGSRRGSLQLRDREQRAARPQTAQRPDGPSGAGRAQWEPVS